jgi:hypothetical protein
MMRLTCALVVLLVIGQASGELGTRSCIAQPQADE